MNLQNLKFPAQNSPVHAIETAARSREKIRAVFFRFTPCTAPASLLEAFIIAAENAMPGKVILLSEACSSFDQFRKYQRRTKSVLCSSTGWRAPICRGLCFGDHDMQTLRRAASPLRPVISRNSSFASGFFEEKPRCKKPDQTTSTPQTKGRVARATSQ
jgi:hypothetical protein